MELIIEEGSVEYYGLLPKDHEEHIQKERKSAQAPYIYSEYDTETGFEIIFLTSAGVYDDESDFKSEDSQSGGPSMVANSSPSQEFVVPSIGNLWKAKTHRVPNLIFQF